MRDKVHQALVPAYLFLCVVLGGSAQGVRGIMVLQLLAVVLIGYSLLRPAAPLPRAARTLFILVGLLIILAAVQLVPLPPGIWTMLPGRELLVRGFELLDLPLTVMPISVAPHATMATALTLLPPIAVLAAMLRAQAFRPSWLVASILAATFAAVLLGALQVGSSASASSPWYLYRRTNHGAAVGFFANSNHMASLLVLAIPLLFALVRAVLDRAQESRAASAAMVFGGAGMIVLLFGIILNGSMAALLLGPPVLALSATMLMSRAARFKVPLALLALVLAIAGIAVMMSPLQSRFVAEGTTSVSSRQEMWSSTTAAIRAHFPVGSGLGSFPELHRHYEDPATVDRTFVNHAHNDYLEVALETGLAGILLVLAFLGWWASRTAAIWRSKLSDRYARAASIASASLLVHSIVDYPLRTVALSAILAACLAVMARPRTRDENAPADLWPTRHATI